MISLETTVTRLPGNCTRSVRLCGLEIRLSVRDGQGILLFGDSLLGSFQSVSDLCVVSSAPGAGNNCEEITRVASLRPGLQCRVRP